MEERIAQIIDHYCGGKQKTLAALMGWTPQYVSKLLHGQRLGIAPITNIVRKFPELNARWLLTGEGSMLGK